MLPTALRQKKGVYRQEGVSVMVFVKNIRQLGNCMATGHRENPNQGRVYDKYALAPTIGVMGGGGRQPMIIVRVVKNE